MDANYLKAPAESDVDQGRETRTADSIGERDRRFDAARWAAARESKRRMPRPAGPAPDPGRKAVDAHLGQHIGGLLFDRVPPQKAVVHALDAPPNQASFGFVGTYVEVDADEASLDAHLVLRFDTRKLGSVARESLRTFRWDKATGRYALIGNSTVSREGDYVYGRITRPGTYVLVGLNMNPAHHLAIRTFWANRVAIENLPHDAAQLLRDRICQVILCAPYLSAFGEESFQSRYAQALGEGGHFPAPGFGGLPPGGDICELCLGIPVGVVPPEGELDIPHGPPGGGWTPCRDGPWEPCGPINLSGDIRQVITDPLDARRLYCAASNGGAWVLDNVDDYPARAWRPLTDQLDSLQVRAVAVAASDPQVLYAANAHGHLSRSTDRGLNWVRTSPADLGAVRAIAVHPANADTVFVASNSGLRLSLNGGAAWTLQHVGDVLDFAVDPQDTSILYLAVRSVGVLKSTTLGYGPWETVLLWSRAAAPLTTEMRLALGYRNADGSLQSDADRRVVAKLDLEIFVNSSGGRSTGAGWVSRGRQGMTSQLWWDNVLAVDPFDPQVIFSGEQELYRSADGGANWTTVASYYSPHEDQKSMAFDRGRRGVAYLSNDGGVFRSTDGGITWFVGGSTTSAEIAARRNLTRDLATAEFYAIGVQGHRALGNLYHSGIIGTANLPTGAWEGAEGHAWEFNNIYADPRRPGRFYVFGGELFRRRYPGTGSGDLLVYGPFTPYKDGFIGFVAVDPRPTSNTILVSAVPSAATPTFRLMMTLQGQLEPSLDASGATVGQPVWSVAVDTGDHPVVSAVFSQATPGQAMAITAAGKLYTKLDVNAAGAWGEPGQWAVAGVRQLAVSAASDQHLTAITSRAVAHSSDGGANWAVVGAATLPDSEFNSIVADTHIGGRLYLGADIGVFLSEDYGQTWSAFDIGLPNSEIFQIFLEGGHLYAVTHGRGLWRRRIC